MNFIDEFSKIVEAMRENYQFPLIWIGLLWFVKVINITMKYRLNYLGIIPRHVFGLLGIFFYPFLHGSFEHLFLNSLPAYILINLVSLYGRETFYALSVFIILTSGLMVWLLGATTGPLGQGVANAVGMALGMKILAEKFNRDKYPIFNNKVYCLAGDGCMIEGISAEASSFAGHLAINNMVLIYDANHVCLDGPLNECMSEDTKLRYKAYGWDVFDLDGYDLDRMEQIFSSLREKQERPALDDEYDYWQGISQ